MLCEEAPTTHNGKSAEKRQNGDYEQALKHKTIFGKDCGRQFIEDSERTYKGTIAWFTEAIKRSLVRGCGIRDTAVTLEVSTGKVLKTLIESHYDIEPNQKHYVRLEVDELWTFVKSKMLYLKAIKFILYVILLSDG